jgi:hypothetical protein
VTRSSVPSVCVCVCVCHLRRMAMHNRLTPLHVCVYVLRCSAAAAFSAPLRVYIDDGQPFSSTPLSSPHTHTPTPTRAHQTTKPRSSSPTALGDSTSDSSVASEFDTPSHSTSALDNKRRYTHPCTYTCICCRYAAICVRIRIYIHTPTHAHAHAPSLSLSLTYPLTHSLL